MSASEAELIRALRNGEEAAFLALVERYHGKLVRLALGFVGEPMVAEEVAQDAWLGLLRGLDRFEGRSSLQTWLFTILTNCARTRAQREGRLVPFADLFDENAEDEPSVDPARFQVGGRWPGHWRQFPASWDGLPEDRILADETLQLVQGAIDQLPPAQRAVILLRDVNGLSAAEICNILDISESSQRVLLHRARAKVQRALARYFDED